MGIMHTPEPALKYPDKASPAHTQNRQNVAFCAAFSSNNAGGENRSPYCSAR